MLGIGIGTCISGSCGKVQGAGAGIVPYGCGDAIVELQVAGYIDALGVGNGHSITGTDIELYVGESRSSATADGIAACCQEQVQAAA